MFTFHLFKPFLLKRETGKSEQDHIHFYIIRLSKNKLLNSSSKIGKTAYELESAYP